MMEYKDKKLGARGLRTVTDVLREIGEMLVNKRSRSLTLYGWIVVFILGIILLNIYKGKSATGGPETRPDLLRFNPKLEDVEPRIREDHPDPQREEFERIAQANKEGHQPPQIPVFNPNLHPEAHKHPGQEEVDKHGLPQPKNFPVPVLQAPLLTCGPELDLLILVQTRPETQGARTAIRKTWGKYDEEKFKLGSRPRWATIFIMGETDDRYQKEIPAESAKFGDILQGGFRDTPFENTRKFMLALDWVNQNLANCRPKFILKTQENIFHNMHAMIPWLEDRFPVERGLFAGKVIRMDRPVRDVDDPLRVPEADYPAEFYPDLIQGPVYLFSTDTFQGMYRAMSKVVPLALEDAYVGLLVNQAGFEPQDNDHFVMLRRPSNICHHLKMFFIYDIMPYEHLEIFKSMKKARTRPECLQAIVVDHKNGKNQHIKIGL